MRNYKQVCTLRGTLEKTERPGYADVLHRVNVESLKGAPLLVL